MTESYVDLTYRGLPLARRVKLTGVRPREGYVEMPAPMPVGTQLRLATDDGLAIDARVIGVTEQTAGAAGAPGMQLAPELAGAAATWWAARVTLDEAPPKPERTVIELTAPPGPAVPAKSTTAPMHAVAPAPVDVIAPPAKRELGGEDSSPVIEITGGVELAAGAEDDDDDRGERTRVMDAAVAAVMIEQAAGDSNPRMGSIVDDGQRTTMMEAVDLAALGLVDPGVPAPVAAEESSAVPDEIDDKNPDLQSKPTATGTATVKRRRKKKSPA